MEPAAETAVPTSEEPPPRAPTKQELRQEIVAAESAARQLLLVLQTWPAFVPSCIAPLREEKRADESDVIVLRCPVKVVTTLALVSHNSKAASTAERFKPMLQRLTLVPRDALRAQIGTWAGADQIGEALSKSAAGPRLALFVVAVEISDGESTHAQCALLSGLEGEDAERGPWQYCLNDGRSFAIGPPKFEWTGDLRPGRISSRRQVPPSCARNLPDYAGSGVPRFEQEHGFQLSPPCLDAAGAARARAVARLGREILDLAHRAVRPGVTTDEIDRVVHEATVEAGAYPAPLNYRNFPKSVCTSVNEVVCHGIPDSRELQDGDIVNVDVTAILDGFYGDLNETFLVGTSVAVETKQLVKCSHDSLMAAISECRPGARYRDLGDTVSAHVKKCGFAVDRTYCGHGIGVTFHQAPSIPHYAQNKAKGVMKAGHCFTVEPMINMGSWRDKLWPDGWTSVTSDGKPSAQFEHMLLITETGCEVLSARLPTSPPLWWEV